MSLTCVWVCKGAVGKGGSQILQDPSISYRLHSENFESP